MLYMVFFSHLKKLKKLHKSELKVLDTYNAFSFQYTPFQKLPNGRH